MFIANFSLKSAVQKAFMFARIPVDYALFHPYRAMQVKALEDTVAFIEERMPGAVSFDTPKELLAHGLTLAPTKGLILEFGVNEGGTVNFIASKLDGRMVHGFDSFEGLPEDWSGNNMAAGYFSRGGKPPRVKANVRLHKGWFDASLPGFLAANPGPIAFMHVDCDLYSSTKTIFDLAGDRIAPGTVIVFDEYFNYPNWRAHEHRAFEEFAARSPLAFDYVGYAFRQVAVVARARS